MPDNQEHREGLVGGNMKTIAILLASISLSLAGAALPFESGLTIDNGRPSNNPSRQRPQDKEPLSSHSVGHFPMNFELNLGQVDRRVMFLSRGKNLSLFLTPSEAVLQWAIADRRIPTNQASSVGSFFAPKAGTITTHELLPFLPYYRVAD